MKGVDHMKSLARLRLIGEYAGSVLMLIGMLIAWGVMVSGFLVAITVITGLVLGAGAALILLFVDGMSRSTGGRLLGFAIVALLIVAPGIAALQMDSGIMFESTQVFIVKYGAALALGAGFIAWGLRRARLPRVNSHA